MKLSFELTTEDREQLTKDALFIAGLDNPPQTNELSKPPHVTPISEPTTAVTKPSIAAITQTPTGNNVLETIAEKPETRARIKSRIRELLGRKILSAETSPITKEKELEVATSPSWKWNNYTFLDLIAQIEGNYRNGSINEAVIKETLEGNIRGFTGERISAQYSIEALQSRTLGDISELEGTSTIGGSDSPYGRNKARIISGVLQQGFAISPIRTGIPGGPIPINTIGIDPKLTEIRENRELSGDVKALLYRKWAERKRIQLAQHEYITGFSGWSSNSGNSQHETTLKEEFTMPDAFILHGDELRGIVEVKCYKPEETKALATAMRDVNFLGHKVSYKSNSGNTFNLGADIDKIQNFGNFINAQIGLENQYGEFPVVLRFPADSDPEDLKAIFEYYKKRGNNVIIQTLPVTSKEIDDLAKTAIRDNIDTMLVRANNRGGGRKNSKKISGEHERIYRAIVQE